MVRIPNKLYSIEESTIWQMYEIRRAIPKSGISVKDLYSEFSEYAIDDFIDALTGLYAIKEIKIEDQIIKRYVTRDTM